MMKKLIKYEMRAMLRLFLPMWPALILISIINHFTLRADFYSDTAGAKILSILVGILMFLYVVLIMAISIVALIVMIRRFYVGLLKEEGYLMFTLPVKTSDIIWSKCISAVILTAITGVVCMISVFIMAFDAQTLKDLFAALQSAEQLMSGVGWFVVECIIAFVLMAVVSSVASIMMAYCAMSIGQTVNKHKLGMSILIYIAISTALSTLYSVFMTILTVSSALTDSAFAWVDRLFADGCSHAGASTLLWVICGGAVLLGVIQTVAFYFPTHFMLKNKLNLE